MYRAIPEIGYCHMPGLIAALRMRDRMPWQRLLFLHLLLGRSHHMKQ